MTILSSDIKQKKIVKQVIDQILFFFLEKRPWEKTGEKDGNDLTDILVDFRYGGLLFLFSHHRLVPVEKIFLFLVSLLRFLFFELFE